MSLELHSIIYPVRDLQVAKQTYATLLGTEPHMDQPYYVGFATAGPELGLDPHGHASGLTAPVPHWKVADIDATLAAMVESGATEQQAPRDVGGASTIRYRPERAILGIPIGERIRIDRAGFERLATAYFGELRARFT